MKHVLLGVALTAAVVIGYVARALFPEAPNGVDLEYWRAVCRRRRRKILRRLAGRPTS